MNLERNYKLKRVLLLSFCVLVLSGLAGCRETEITDKSMYSDNEQVGSLGKVLYPVSIDAGDGNKNGIGNFFIIFRMNLF